MKRQIEESLRRSAGQLPQPSFEKIAQADVTPMRRHDYITEQQTDKNKTRRPFAALATVACLLVLLAVGGWFWQFRMVDAVINIDINPSFEITLNRQQEILNMRPLNSEAEQVLEGRNYKGWHIDDAVETLFLGLDSQGYLQNPTVLLSVSGRSETASNHLSKSLSGQVVLAFINKSTTPGIYTQTLQLEKALQQKAEEYGVSAGKMRLVTALVQKNVPFPEVQLAGMPVDELLRLAEEYAVDGLTVVQYPATAQEQPPASSSATSAPVSQAPAATPVPTPSPQQPQPQPQQPQTPPASDDDDDDDDDNDSDRDDNHDNRNDDRDDADHPNDD